ncbi:serine/arginine repetitive matrix protein 1-like [Heliangelus exortis]|uniref:serine/arginine repetitive matrix protein 1-like n=1 Tax=Heliangelus exortis TaxID=472823 RepID=UPI003A93D961
MAKFPAGGTDRGPASSAPDVPTRVSLCIARLRSGGLRGVRSRHPGVRKAPPRVCPGRAEAHYPRCRPPARSPTPTRPRNRRPQSARLSPQARHLPSAPPRRWSGLPHLRHGLRGPGRTRPGEGGRAAPSTGSGRIGGSRSPKVHN